MNKVMKEFLNTAIYLLCVLGAVWLVITFVGQRTEVEGASMENTLHNGDNLIVDKLSYRFRDPERFDIIVFPFQYQAPIVLGEDEYFVMGDNRNNSSDSRTDIVGNIKREDIIGKAWLRIWPLSDFGVLKHQ